MVLHCTQSVESELKDKPSESPQLVGIKSSSIISSKQIKVQQHVCAFKIPAILLQELCPVHCHCKAYPQNVDHVSVSKCEVIYLAGQHYIEQQQFSTCTILFPYIRTISPFTKGLKHVITM